MTKQEMVKTLLGIKELLGWQMTMVRQALSELDVPQNAKPSTDQAQRKKPS